MKLVSNLSVNFLKGYQKFGTLILLKEQKIKRNYQTKRMFNVFEAINEWDSELRVKDSRLVLWQPQYVKIFINSTLLLAELAAIRCYL